MDKNDIEDVESIKPILANNENMFELNVLGNPLCKQNKYRDQIILHSHVALSMFLLLF